MNDKAKIAALRAALENAISWIGAAGVLKGLQARLSETLALTADASEQEPEHADLCQWLRDNSSGIYRRSAEAADLIERLAAPAAPVAVSVFDTWPKTDGKSPETRMDASFQPGREPYSTAAPVADTGAVYQFRQKGCEEWIECDSNTEAMMEDGPTAGYFEFRTLYTAPATPTATADSAPKFDEAEFAAMVERGTAAFKDVPDNWLEQQRGADSAADARWNPTDKELVAMQEDARDAARYEKLRAHFDASKDYLPDSITGAESADAFDAAVDAMQNKG
jgi:hypothetical protein